MAIIFCRFGICDVTKWCTQWQVTLTLWLDSVSATIWGLLVRDQWTLWPPTPVTLASLSMETPPGLVRVMECGVGQLQLVSVSGNCLFVECVISHTVNCPDLLPPINGMIIYSGGSTGIRFFGSGATYTCNPGYTLAGGATRFCVGGGRWNGSPPTCQGECNSCIVNYYEYRICSIRGRSCIKAALK